MDTFEKTPFPKDPLFQKTRFSDPDFDCADAPHPEERSVAGGKIAAIFWAPKVSTPHKKALRFFLATESRKRL